MRKVIENRIKQAKNRYFVALTLVEVNHGYNTKDLKRAIMLGRLIHRGHNWMWNDLMKSGMNEDRTHNALRAYEQSKKGKNEI